MQDDRVGNDILDFVGCTPTVQLRRVVSASSGQIHVKLECTSPTASVEDRLARPLWNEIVTKHGDMTGRSLFVASSGNQAISLAVICAQNKCALHVVMPEHMSLEKRQLVAAYGAQLKLSAFEEGFAGARRKASEWSALAPNGVYFELESQPVAVNLHEETTASELVETIRSNDGRIDAFVCGVSSGALFTAIGRRLKQNYPSVQLVAVEPKSSPILSSGRSAPHRLAGLAVDELVPNLDRGLVEHIVSVSDESAWAMKARLGAEEGLLVGPSTGANVLAAIQWAEKLGKDARVYTMALDSGERYFSIARQFT